MKTQEDGELKFGGILRDDGFMFERNDRTLKPISNAECERLVSKGRPFRIIFDGPSQVYKKEDWKQKIGKILKFINKQTKIASKDIRALDPFLGGNHTIESLKTHISKETSRQYPVSADQMRRIREKLSAPTEATPAEKITVIDQVIEALDNNEVFTINQQKLINFKKIIYLLGII